jgi:drug/metabolite transporter (DMT)-like permease
MKIPSDKPSLIFGIVITIFAYFCFAIASSCVKAMGPSIPAFEIVFFQNFISLICILPYCLKKGTLNFRRPFISFHLIRDVCGTGSYLCYFAAISHTNLVDATVLAYTAPFFTPIIWSVWMRDKIEKDVWWTIVLGFIGIAFILKPSENIFHIGSLFGIVAGVLTSFGLVAIRILNQKHASLSRTLFYYFLVGSIITFPLMISSWQRPSILQSLFLLAIGLTTVVGQIMLTIAYRHGTASFLSPLCYSIVIFIVLISWIIFNNKPEITSFIGAGIIVFGGTLSFILRKKPKTVLRLFENPHHIGSKWWEFWRKKPPE